MTARSEVSRWLRDARASLESARRGLAHGDARVACQMGQLAVELSAKAVIASVAEPAWTHDPSAALALVLGESDVALDGAFGPGARASLERLQKDARRVAPWHGWSTYGRRRADGAWEAAVDVCTADAARDLIETAERAVTLASRLGT